MENQAFLRFATRVHHLIGLDLTCYKSRQMLRRLSTLMNRVGVAGFDDYARLLEESPERLKEFRDFITINVSEFLRNPGKFEELKSNVLPQLLARKRQLNIWSAGCSNGAEPYSLAMLLDELTPGRPHRILGTDIDEEILKVAREGLYTADDIREVSPARRARYFRAHGEQFRVVDALRSNVHFAVHNLLKDPFPMEMDLIVCRNVVIYFTDKAKDQLYRNFHQSLVPGGILFVGGTESMFNAREIGFEPMAPMFYRRTGTPATPGREVAL
ncbi:MAG: protein-glutamate O-methyltransferase CheR [Bacillota bacterium]